MKNYRLNFLTAILLMAMVPQSINAQFFKKLLKSAGKVLTESVTTPQSQFGGVQGIDVEWVECQRWGDDVRVQFALVNNSRSDIEMSFFNTWPSGEKHTFAIADSGDRYGIDFIYLGGNVNDNCSVLVPSGVKVQCVARINKAGGKVDKFKYISIGGWIAGQQKPNYSYLSPRMEVKEIANTDREHLSCTLPSIFVSEKSIIRKQKDVTINFSLLEASGQDMKLTLGDLKVFDSNGNAYQAELKPGYTASMISDVPFNMTLTIKNVPEGITMSIVRLSVAGNYKIEWRNVEMPDTEGQATTNNQ